MEILGGEPSPFILPLDGGKTLIVTPDGTLDVIVSNPPANGFLEIKLTGVPENVPQRRFKFEGAGPVEQVFDMQVKDYAAWGQGVYEVDFALLDSSESPICQTAARVRIDGFGGVVGYASAAATAVAGIRVVANIIGNIKSGLLQARIKASVAIERRRRRGLRRWVPIPSLRRTIKGTIIGTITGVVLMVLLQQGGCHSSILTKCFDWTGDW